MQHFAALLESLESLESLDAQQASTATQDQLATLVQYFAQADASDAAWAVYLLTGGRLRPLVPLAALRAAACQQAGVDDWLFEACYQAVGDLAETIAHIVPQGPAAPDAGAPGCNLAHWMVERLPPLRGLPLADQVRQVQQLWAELDVTGRHLMIRLIGGRFRVHAPAQRVQQALAQCTGLEPALIAQRLVGWADAKCPPTASRWRALVAPAGHGTSALGQPYPFFLAQPLPAPPQTLGAATDWLIEWQYDGIRAQVIKRSGQVWLWTRGDALITARLPEVAARAAHLPDGTVLDGELLAWQPGAERPAPFKLLQQRMNRKTVDRKLLADVPVVFVAFDLLEAGGEDLRDQPLAQRRAALRALFEDEGHPLEADLTADLTVKMISVDTAAGVRGLFRVSPALQVRSWQAAIALHAQSRARGMQGCLLKAVHTRYASGPWWTWKAQPWVVHAVLIYAQAGLGARAGAGSDYTDCTFAVWSRAPASADEAQAVVQAIERRVPAPPRSAGALQLLPVAKACFGPGDAAAQAVHAVIRATTLEKFGPVRSLRPTLVFEIGFEGIAASPRHKSGLAVRLPHIVRLRPDKALHEADSLATLQALVGIAEPG